MLLLKSKEKEYNLTYPIEFKDTLEDIIKNRTVQKMKNNVQHGDTSCFEHCMNVAYYSFILCKKLHLDYISAARGGMLHDLFLYNWRKHEQDVELEGLHAFVHPKIALRNSLELFELNKIEKDIILNHMWPLTIRPPRYIETYIITFVDKYCAINETLKYIQKKRAYSFMYRYSTVLLAFLVLNI